MNLAKVPDNEEARWDSLDIFLFTNGQEQSPPRKYHLNANELNLWDAMLKTLAQSLYGATQSLVDLYTIDGNKVVSPTEITNESIYVAVPPRDEFIHAGYTDYLLKASRSREKRTGKLKSQVDYKFIQKEVTDGRKITSGSTVVNVPKVTSPSGDQPVSVTRSQTCCRNIFPAKLLDKRTLKSPTVIRKNIINLPNSIMQRTSLKSKDNLSRKNLRVSTGRITSKDPVLLGNQNNPSKSKPQNNPSNPKPKLISKGGKDSNASDITKTLQYLNGNTNVSKDINMLTDSCVIENVNDEKELIVVKNPDSSVLYSDNSTIVKEMLLVSTIPTMPIIEENHTTKSSREETTVTVVNNYEENTYNPDVVNNNELYSKNYDILKINEPKQEQIPVYTNKLNINKTSPVDNFVTVIDKGDVIKLKLNLEVRKADGEISAHCNMNQNQLNLTEKSSQVEINELFIQSIEEKSYSASTKLVRHEELKSAAVHCACCNSSFKEILKQINNSPDFDGSHFVFFISDPELLQKLPRCNCDEVMNSKAWRETRQLSTSSPIKKVHADTSLLNVKEKRTSAGLYVTESQIQSSSEKNQELEKERQICNEYVISGVNSKTKSVLESYSDWADPLEKTEVKLRPNSSHINKQFIDNSTQTEWTSILLETRLHEEGRYSFHFPPLHVLKRYEL